MTPLDDLQVATPTQVRPTYPVKINGKFSASIELLHRVNMVINIAKMANASLKALFILNTEDFDDEQGFDDGMDDVFFFGSDDEQRRNWR